jgi:hypothetical protein
MTDISYHVMSEPSEHDPRLGRLRDPDGTAMNAGVVEDIEVEFNQETGRYVRVQYQDDQSAEDIEQIPGVHNQDGVDDFGPSVYFPGDNPTAFPIFSRASNDFNSKALTFTAAANQIPKQLVGRTKGRQSITMTCPITFTYQGNIISPIGFIFSSEMGACAAGDGFQVNVGDSVTIYTESEVWVSCIPGVTTGQVVVQYIEETNPVRGSLGSN